MQSEISSHLRLTADISQTTVCFGITIALILLMVNWTSNLYAAPPTGGHGLREQKNFNMSIFIAGDSQQDKDNDFLIDDLENKLAWHFRPYLIFDSREGHTKSFEPVVLVQVRPSGCVGLGCGTTTIVIKYAFLWAKDGGYGESSDCKDAHNGDNQSMSIRLHSYDDGHSWRLDSPFDVDVGDEAAYFAYLCDKATDIFDWAKCLNNPSAYGIDQNFRPVLWPNIQRPVLFPYVFLSSHKHHMYTSAWNDEDDSIYSDWGCNDDVDGNGRNYYSCLSPDCSDPAFLGHTNNIGEPESHDPAYFIHDLGRWYPGENVWSGKAFKGGLGNDGGETSSLASMWLGHSFRLSDQHWELFTAQLIPML